MSRKSGCIWFSTGSKALNILPILLKRYLRVDTSSNLTDEQKKKNRVIIVGGGFSGIGMGCILKMAGMDFLILEKGSQVGGTWNYNKFPGAATDAKCAGYSYTFYDFKDWKRVYPYRKCNKLQNISHIIYEPFHNIT